MKKVSFNDNWAYRHLNTEEAWVDVTLPFDAMLREPKSKAAKGMQNIGWFESYDYEYRKEFELTEEMAGQKILLEFEGIYHNAEIYINGEKVAERPYGYTQILVPATAYLKVGQPNEIRVIAHNADQPNSRWYSGSGIYRPVWMYLADEEEHILPYGVKIRTLSLNPAKVEVSVQTSRPGQVSLEILDQDGHMVLEKTSEQTTDFEDYADLSASSESEVKKQAKAVFVAEIPEAKLWTAETPDLYEAVVTFGQDKEEVTFGIREIAWDTANGLTVNGDRVILKGACIHSDNQLLGAEVYPEAEERRVRLLKEAGYNAIRSAHNPCSKDLLDACDRLGMYMMDEYVDMWYIHKNQFDYATYMPDWWRRDLKDMVDKDYNHPSVILYSYGNEVAETGQKRGIQLAEDMTNFLHSQDATRPVTCGVNIFFNYLYRLGFGVYSDDKAEKDAEAAAKDPSKKKKAVGSEFFNQLAGLLGDTAMKTGATLHGSDVLTRGAFAKMDMAGYNYGIMRYRMDLKKYPERLILGSETFCRDAYSFWELAKKNPRLIGDFVWAGMDYLGEAGIGSWEYEDYAPENAPEEGWLAAGSGRLDLTGKEIGEALYTKVAFEEEQGPFLTVSPVYQTGKHHPSAWKMTDTIESWSWRGCEGKKADIEVYARAERIDLLINGRRITSRKVKDCIARFRVPYENGMIEAIAYDKAGNEIGTSILKTAGEETELRLLPEKEKAVKGQLSYIRLRFTDKDGIWKPMDHHTVKVEVENGELVRLGSGCPYNLEGFLTDETKTYYGEALAIVRANGEGDLKIRAWENDTEAEAVIPVIA